MVDHTVAMAERTGEQSAWVLKSRQARDAIAQATRRGARSLGPLAVHKEQLQAAFDAFRRSGAIAARPQRDLPRTAMLP